MVRLRTETPVLRGGEGMTGATDDEAREFAQAFHSFLRWVHSDEALGDDRNEVVALVRRFLGDTAADLSVITRTLEVFEHVNLQTALDAWCREDGREVEVHGFVIPPHHGSVGLQQLISGEGMPPLRLTAPPLVDLPNGPGSSLACLLRALLLVNDREGRYVLMVNGPHEHDPALEVEIAGLSVEAAQRVHSHLADLRRRLNVYRGQVLDVHALPMGGVSLEFGAVPQLTRADVILPESTLDRIERHALDVARHREGLLRAGQHLKRGLLLYGPPGTGKTHTMRYLLGQMEAYTRLVLTGRSLHAIGSVAELARELQPAVIVLEDVDLVAEDRSFGPGTSPVLFDLLDAMDGAAPDADLLFVLTTNRADLLEPALAARPGRVDLAIEIDLPDATARERLLTLYGQATPIRLTEADTQSVVERTEGVTASFLKELIRRAILQSLHADPASATVTAAHLSVALDELLDSGHRLTQSLLGVGNDPQTLPPGGGVGALPPQRFRGRWAAYPPRP
jgi:cell division protease FtsH